MTTKEKIDILHRDLYATIGNKIEVNDDLNRSLVSFQANKKDPINRLFSFKEGFSADLMQYLFAKMNITAGSSILDPFAGSGTLLLEALRSGISSTGIEILPCVIEVVNAKQILIRSDRKQMEKNLKSFRLSKSWEKDGIETPFGHLRVTAGAFPEKEEHLLCRYLYDIKLLRDKDTENILRFAAVCVVSSISYTQKDGSCLRWDSRSGRRRSKTVFHKKKILGFSEAISSKIKEIESDLKNYDTIAPATEMNLMHGSCLEIMPNLESESYDAIITSPPYLNRYDYTRIYALELATVGVGESEIKEMRQAMLSSTVENKHKSSLNIVPSYDRAKLAIQEQQLLQEILVYLDECKQNKTINNAGVLRMVSEYFMEMAIVIFESSRILKYNAPLVMINDNVRYVGVEIPVDLILSDLALKSGFEIEKIWSLPNGKGNSSQQMKKYGRSEIRKCVYIWRKKM